MSIKRLSLSIVAAALVVALSPSAQAVVIHTNDGTGADAEVRESQHSEDFGGNVTGSNRGASSELSTRIATNRSSVSFAKFDISGLPATNDSFWDTKTRVAFDIFARQNGNFKLFTAGTNLAGDPTDVVLNVLALDPNGTYSNSRTDRSGNNYTALNNAYDWNESAVDFYDAPGISPHCKLLGSCAGADPNDVISTLGTYDDFDGNVISLGEIVPTDQHPAVSELDGGDRLTYEAANLRDLVLSAIDAGQDTVTIMYHMKGPDHDDANQSALGRNYNLTPKEHLSLSTSSGVPLDNSMGDYSPTLRIVPEPASLALVGLSCFGLLVVRRRRS